MGMQLTEPGPRVLAGPSQLEWWGSEIGFKVQEVFLNTSLVPPAFTEGLSHKCLTLARWWGNSEGQDRHSVCPHRAHRPARKAENTELHKMRTDE
jgi:hypothetical protein